MIGELEDVPGHDVSRETLERLSEYVALLVTESEKQNLIARSTLLDIWRRHIADSAQLIPLVKAGKSWADIGSGAGLPGMVVAILTGDPMTLIEPRKLRADFLSRAADELKLANVRVVARKVEATDGNYDVISARAVAPAVDLLRISQHLTHKETKFLLMKGRSAETELEQVRRAWHGDFNLIASRTDEEAAILVAEHVRRRGGDRK
jgi:16S rRNA (guanine527-N7)-methyltransferase